MLYGTHETLLLAWSGWSPRSHLLWQRPLFFFCKWKGWENCPPFVSYKVFSVHMRESGVWSMYRDLVVIRWLICVSQGWGFPQDISVLAEIDQELHGSQFTLLQPWCSLLSCFIAIIAAHTGFLLHADAANVKNHSSSPTLRSWKQSPFSSLAPQFPLFRNLRGWTRSYQSPFLSSELRFYDFCHWEKWYLLILWKPTKWLPQKWLILQAALS